MKLSTLNNANTNCITYYVGDNFEHVKHLKNCTLICNHNFNPILKGVKLIKTYNPQLFFYRLSHKVCNEYKFTNKNIKIGSNSLIHSSCVIGDDVVIGNNVELGPNTVIFSKSVIGNNTRIGSNVTIGGEGMMWIWNRENKVFLKQLGGVKIGNNCIIGCNSVIVRGSANEFTIINDGVNMSPGCNIGHGAFIGKNSHLANNVAIGGSAYICDDSFLGSSSVVSPQAKILKKIILGANSLANKIINSSGVYVGSPAIKIKEINGKHNGVPVYLKT